MGISYILVKNFFLFCIFMAVSKKKKKTGYIIPQIIAQFIIPSISLYTKLYTALWFIIDDSVLLLLRIT